MIERIQEGVPVQRAATDAGISERMAHRGLKRWHAGDRELVHHSSAPLRRPHQLAAAQVERIEELGRERLTDRLPGLLA